MSDDFSINNKIRKSCALILPKSSCSIDPLMFLAFSKNLLCVTPYNKNKKEKEKEKTNKQTKEGWMLYIYIEHLYYKTKKKKSNSLKSMELSNFKFKKNNQM